MGESDVIRIAEMNPENTLLIMDDHIARLYALKSGLSIIGTIRLLDIAEQQGVFSSAEACISDMAERGYRISVVLLARIRQSGKPA